MLETVCGNAGMSAAIGPCAALEVWTARPLQLVAELLCHCPQTARSVPRRACRTMGCSFF